jgi:hypothetical protein
VAVVALGVPRRPFELGVVGGGVGFLGARGGVCGFGERLDRPFRSGMSVSGAWSSGGFVVVGVDPGLGGELVGGWELAHIRAAFGDQGLRGAQRHSGGS